MSKANYFYIISYPEYNGFRVEHDPVCTAVTFAPSEASTTSRTGTGALLVVIGVIVVFALVAAAVVLRRRPKQQART